MKRVLVSLLVGMTLCGGLFGCGNDNSNKVVEDKVVEYNFNQEQEDLQPYRDAAAYIQQEVNKSGCNYQVYLNEATKTMEISYDTGDTSVSDLRRQGFDDETIKLVGDFEELYSVCQFLATTCYSEVVVIYGVGDIQINVTVKIGGETVCTFNQKGECEYSIL